MSNNILNIIYFLYVYKFGERMLVYIIIFDVDI